MMRVIVARDHDRGGHGRDRGGVVVAQCSSASVARIGLQQLLGRHLLVARLGLAEDVIDHLLLEDRRAQLDQRRGFFS
jgi:hypothetical protein